MLRASGNRLFYYYRSDAENAENNMKVDFLVRIGRKVCPIEVKSPSSDSISSLKKFHKKFPNTGQPTILYSGDMKMKNGILYLPLYMAMFLCPEFNSARQRIHENPDDLGVLFSLNIIKRDSSFSAIPLKMISQ